MLYHFLGGVYGDPLNCLYNQPTNSTSCGCLVKNAKCYSCWFKIEIRSRGKVWTRSNEN